MHASTSGGSSDSDANDDTVMPVGPSGPVAVTTVTPLAHRESAARNSPPETDSSGTAGSAAGLAEERVAIAAMLSAAPRAVPQCHRQETTSRIVNWRICDY